MRLKWRCLRTISYDLCEENKMKHLKQLLVFSAALFAAIGVANAGKYEDTVSLFKNAGESAAFFKNSYAYAVFPNIGEGAFVEAVSVW